MILSIVIAAYNVEKFIEKCVLSCSIAQNDNYEIIVVDDGSTDSTLHILKKLSKEISNLRIINKKNEGLGAARNSGIKESKGFYVWMIDGDDYLETQEIKSILNHLEERKADIYTINYNVVSDNKIVNTNKEIGSNNIYNGTNYYQEFYAISYTVQYIFKISLFIDNNILFKERINMQDSEILPKILFHTEKLIRLDLVAYNYVQHKESFTNSHNFQKRYKYFESIIVVKESLTKFSKRIENENELLSQVINIKIQSFDKIIFNHIFLFPYKRGELSKIVKLLHENGMYPLKFSPNGLGILLTYLFNVSPNLAIKAFTVYKFINKKRLF